MFLLILLTTPVSKLKEEESFFSDNSFSFSIIIIYI